MLDINYIRQNPEETKKAVKSKGFDPAIVDRLLILDKQRRQLINQTEKLKQAKNKIVNKFKDKGVEAVEGKLPRAFLEDYKKTLGYKKKIAKIEPELRKAEEEYRQLMFQVPNPPAKDVKEGRDESANEVVKKWGRPKKFVFKPKDHLEIGEKLGIIDMARAAKVSGSRFAYLKGDAVLLGLALIHHAFATLIKEGFKPLLPQTLIRREAMQGMGYLEHGGEEDMFCVAKDDLFLVGTSEQAIGPMHSNEILSVKDLPIRYVAFSSCFRREAGSYGKDTRGIFRVHQFDKVEMFIFCQPEKSDEEHEFLLKLEEKFFQELKIPYQIVKMCSGDLGAPAARKYDLEAWLPGQRKYREVTSTSSCTDFQARRLKIKYHDGKKTDYVHTLNGTTFALGRTIIAILENYQQKDGSVTVPQVLQKYVGKKNIDRAEPA